MEKNILSTHLDHKCDHEENRLKLCATCGKKIVFGNRQRSEFLITENLAGLIKKHVNDNFDESNSKFPISICSTCRKTIMEREKGNAKRPLPTMPNYEDMKLAKETRTTYDCNCFICLTARYKGHSKIVKGNGHVRTFHTIIDESCGLYGAASNAQLPSTSGHSTAEKRTSMNICSKCFQKIGKGVRHSCGAGPASSRARENALSLVEKLPEKQQNQVVTSILRKRSEASTNDGDILLNTTGSKMRVTLNKKIENEFVFNTEGLDTFQSTTGASQNQMNKMTNFIRSFAGRKSIPKNYKQHMREKSNLLEDIYKEVICIFESKEGMVNRPVVYANASNLINAIFDHRDITEIQNAKIKLVKAFLNYV